MVSQEIQTISCLLKGNTGRMWPQGGENLEPLPQELPSRVAFLLDGGKEIYLAGFKTAHPSIVRELGKKTIAVFSLEEAAAQRLSREHWEELTKSANAVLLKRLSPDGQTNRYYAAVLERIKGPWNGAKAVIAFRNTGIGEAFVPCSY